MELKAVARIIALPRKEGVPSVPPPEDAQRVETHPRTTPETQPEKDFFDRLAEQGISQDRLLHEQKRLLAEVTVLRSENRWEDILTLLHPVEEKAPELAAAGLETPLLSEIAFALDHLDRFDEAIALGRRCVENDPDNFHYQAGLAYTAYQSLYAAKTSRVMLHPAERRARIELAHRHLEQAQALRPDGVTNFYRQGMLYKEIQNKKDKALPLFETAVRNWDSLSHEDRQRRHQERKNFVKSLYQLGSCLLDAGKAEKALEAVLRCIREDDASQHLQLVHKYFALGKIYVQLGQWDRALDALNFAAAQADPDDDYVFELLARVHLSRGETERARQAIDRIPLRKRRPYVRWTESDVLAAQGKIDLARQVLLESVERDRRSRHKGLMRLARIDFRRRDYEACLQWVRDAQSFFLDHYQNSFAEGMLWEAAALIRLGRFDEAAQVAKDLAAAHPWHPHLGRLRKALAEAQVQAPHP